MVFVKRGAQGQIVAVGTDPQEGWESFPDNDPEVVAFGEVLASSGSELARTDLEMARVLEDLIELLVERSVIRFTDLPDPAQAKLLQRRRTRTSIRSLDLLGNEDVI